MLDLLPSADEALITDAIDAFLDGEMPIERFRDRGQPGDPAFDAAAIGELGWFGLGLPESVGGADMGPVAEILLQRACGRHLVTPTLPATVLAAHAALQGGDAGLARTMVEGRQPVALALAAGTADGRPCVSVIDWQPGRPALLIDDEAVRLLAPEALASLYLEPGLDGSLSLHHGPLVPAPALIEVLARQAPLLAHARLLLAAALVGLAEQSCRLTTDYVCVREQFGRPIGSFQAVKHRCADMAVDWRLAWYQTARACLLFGAGVADAGWEAAAAKHEAARAAHSNARAAIQLHGGVGFQAECDVHHYMKRAHLYDQVAGAIPQLARLLARGVPAA